MEIQYQRNLKNSYMVVIESERPLNPDGELAERMLQRQQISGLLTWVSLYEPWIYGYLVSIPPVS